jgi:hypothetical protein
MNAKLYNQVEIAFWDFIIRALTESRFAQGLVRLVYPFIPGKTLQTILFAAAVGFLSGFVLYVVAYKLLLG